MPNNWITEKQTIDVEYVIIEQHPLRRRKMIVRIMKGSTGLFNDPILVDMVYLQDNWADKHLTIGEVMHEAGEGFLPGQMCAIFDDTASHDTHSVYFLLESKYPKPIIGRNPQRGFVDTNAFMELRAQQKIVDWPEGM